jgi:hypothetical protein
MVGRLITSASHAHGRTAEGGQQRGGAGRGSGSSVALGGRCPERIGMEWAEVGPGAGPAVQGNDLGYQGESG